MAKTQDLVFHLGNQWQIDAACFDADGKPLDVIDAEWRAASDTALVVKATVATGEITLGGNVCTTAVRPGLQPPPGIYEHELYVVGPDTASIQIVGQLRVLESL